MHAPYPFVAFPVAFFLLVNFQLDFGITKPINGLSCAVGEALKPSDLVEHAVIKYEMLRHKMYS